ncbi:hypothetical protein GIB67_018339 [Kingdonia uniflora]|uniref:Pentatricopeptide repeat-containing protein n=1 Tax=Kingdonia uniflora TaxID=39325 RepID=A0A7J7MJA1_9MAGN|nr:hypothetical protein GIB67_018339 [Kingdonia uniflora]
MSQISASTLSSLLRNCVSLFTIHKAKQTHCQILIHGFLPNVTLQTDLLLAYSKCSHIEDARQVFDAMSKRNMHSWNIMISSYIKISLFNWGLSVFDDFLKADFRPDHFTFPSVFKACVGNGGCYFLGKILHGWVVKLGFGSHVVVGCSVLDFYVKHEDVGDAYSVFAGILSRDVVIWNSMINGFVRCGFSIEVLGCFRKMMGEGAKMDGKTIPSVLSACGKEGDLMKGKEIHGQVLKILKFDMDVVIGNSLIDMYAKCGSVEYAEKVFENMHSWSVVTWTTLISGYGVHGKGEKSLILFEKMRLHGFQPNCVTFTAVLASCSHSGLIDQGRSVFNSISLDYGMEPSVEHYACMVDLLGRYGHLEEALELVKKMPEDSPASVWGALLGACRIHKNVEIGETAAYRLFELEVGNSSNYIALCNIYESIGRWDGVSRVRSKMRELGLVKKAACSWISVEDGVHRFYHGDVSHLQTKIACEVLDGTIKAIAFVEF